MTPLPRAPRVSKFHLVTLTLPAVVLDPIAAEDPIEELRMQEFVSRMRQLELSKIVLSNNPTHFSGEVQTYLYHIFRFLSYLCCFFHCFCP